MYHSCHRYVVEMVLAGFDNWQQYKIIGELKITIKGLEEGRQYHFRVKAKNDRGIGQPAVLPNTVTVKDLVAEPTVSIRDTPIEGINKKAGSSLDLSLPISGKPLPDVSWKHNGEVMRQTSRVSTMTDEIHTTLRIKECTLDDAGVYSITVSNSVGFMNGKVTYLGPLFHKAFVTGITY